MNRLLILIFFSTFSLPFCQAQRAKHGSGDIFDSLKNGKNGAGVVHVFQSQRIKEMIGNPFRGGIALTNGDAGEIKKIQGYRVQVYSGNQSDSKTVAANRESEMLEKYPQLPTYVTYSAPFWKLRVGNFLTRSEAEQALIKIKEEFPNLSRQMYVVRDLIEVY